MNVNDVNSKNIIDAASAQRVSDQLFSALQKKKVDVGSKNLTGFNRPTIGVEFYSQKTDISFQRQIAIQNSGVFQKMTLNSVQALNAFAAQELYGAAVSDKVGGKMTIDNVENDFEILSQMDDTQNYMNVFETSKDKRGFNPFSFDQFNKESSNEE